MITLSTEELKRISIKLKTQTPEWVWVFSCRRWLCEKKELYQKVQLFIKVLCISNHKTCPNVVALKGIEPLISP